MTASISGSHYPKYNTPGNQGTHEVDKVSRRVQKLFSKNGISGNVELGQDSGGRISVLNDHPQKSDIENLLNSDAKLSSMLAGKKSSPSGEQKAASDKQGVYHENADGDYVFLSDVAVQALEKRRSNFLGTTDAADRPAPGSKEYFDSIFTQEDRDRLIEEYKQFHLQINYNFFATGNHKDTSGFQTTRDGKTRWFENGSGMNMPAGRGKSNIAAGNTPGSHEADILNSASDSRKKVFSLLQQAMKNAGIELKGGQKVDFIMDEKGRVRVNPDSVKNKDLAAKIENVISSDKKLGDSFINLLSKSSAGKSNDIASMRMHVDSVLREYTGKGFDDLEWDESGSLITPEGYEEAWEEFEDLSYLVGHLKYLQETEGDEIFQKEFSFSVTSSGIIDDQMKQRAGSNLFVSDKMLFERSVYSADTTSAMNFMIEFPSQEERINDFWGMKALEEMIQAKGTTVYLSADPANNFAEDANGSRQALPYKSANYDATANYLIENYFIENGIKGNVSDYALKIDTKGSYEVVRIPPPDVSKIQ